MKNRRSKPSRAAIKAAAKAMKPLGTVSGLKTLQGRIVPKTESTRIVMSAQHRTPDIRQKHSDGYYEPEAEVSESGF